MAKNKLSKTEYQILNTLYNDGEANLNRIKTETNLSRASLIKAITSLKKRGFVAYDKRQYVALIDKEGEICDALSEFESINTISKFIKYLEEQTTDRFVHFYDSDLDLNIGEGFLVFSGETEDEMFAINIIKIWEKENQE